MNHPATEAIVESYGQEQELNTQRCLELQRELLSSSPLHVTQENFNVRYGSYPPLEFRFETNNGLEVKMVTGAEATSSGDMETRLSEPKTNTDIDLNAIKESESKKRQLATRRFIESSILKSPINVEEFTQKSSMSLTQENPVTAYSHLYSNKPFERLHSAPMEGGNSLWTARESSNSESQNASEKHFHSTALAYQMKNACYMKLDLESEIRENKDDDSESLDTPRAVDQFRYSHRNLQQYEPQTPRLPSNPFEKRGNIMQKIDLFAATQPSSVNQYHASPTSSRPSPETCGNYSSPIKRQKFSNSPLEDINGIKKVLEPTSSPAVQVSSKDQQLIFTPVSRAPPFEIKLRNLVSNSGCKFHPYKSVKKNQGRKLRELQPLVSEDSDSSQETFSRRLRDYRAYKEFSKELLEKSQVYHNLVSCDSSKNEIVSIKEYQTDEKNYDSELKTIEINKEKRNIILPCQSSQTEENTTQDSTAAIFGEVKSSNSEKSCKPILAREIENLDLASLSCSDESQLPKLNEKSDQISFIVGNVSQTPAPKEAIKNISSQVLVKKSHLYSETIPETSPLTYEIFPTDELITVPLKEILGSNANTDVGFQAELRTYSQSCKGKKMNLARMSTLPQTPTIPKHKPPQKFAKYMEAEVNSKVLNTAPEVDRVQLTDKSLNGCDHVIYPSTETHVSTSPKSNNHINESSNNKQALKEGSNNNHNNHNNNNNKSISEIQESINGCEKSGNVYKESEPESLLITLSKMTSKTPKKPRKNNSSYLSNSKSELGSRINTTVISSLDASTAACDDFASRSSHQLNHSTRNKNIHTNTGQFNPRKPRAGSTKLSVESTSSKQNTRRKSVRATVAVTAPSTRSSKRQSLSHATEEDSEDPLSARMTPALQNSSRSGLFQNMVFTVSFVKNERERNHVLQLISEHGGLLLDHGFDPLFEPISSSDLANNDCATLSLSALGKSLSFAGVIADEHSRKTKYVQALALGLPCLSGRWIQHCISKNTILDWSPYLLCAGQSSVLGNAYRSRTLQPYPATDAEFAHTFASRKKILQGKSVLLVMGKGKTLQKRKTFNFLTRALGPTRIGYVTDITEAQRLLSEDEAKGFHTWDILHIQDHEKNRGLDGVGAGRKRKFVECDGPSWPNLKRVRIITDEIMIQSLIFGELIDE